MKWLQHERLQCEKCAVWGKAAKKKRAKKRLKQETGQKWRSKRVQKSAPQDEKVKRWKVQDEKVTIWKNKTWK